MQIAYITKHEGVKNALIAEHQLTPLSDHTSKLEIYHNKDVFLLSGGTPQDLQLYLRRTIEETLFEAILIPVDTTTKVNPERWIGDVITPVVLYKGDNALIEWEWSDDARDEHLTKDNTLFLEHINPLSDYAYRDFGYSFGGSLVDLAGKLNSDLHDHIDLLYAVDGYTLEWFDICKILLKSGEMKEALYPLFLVVESESDVERNISHIKEISEFLKNEVFSQSDDNAELLL